MLISQTKIKKYVILMILIHSHLTIYFSHLEKNIHILQIIHVYDQLEVEVNVFLNMKKIYTIRCL